MNITAKTATAMPSIVWWQDRNMLSLVKRTAFKDCNNTEFDEAVAVCRELNLSPLRKQIFAFVFNKGDEAKRNMVLVVSIDGARAIAARHQNYRPDNEAPRIIIDESLKGATNPEGIVSAEVSGFMFSQGEWHKVIGIAHWEEFAPIIKGGDEDDYEWIDTGEKWADSGKPKMKKRLRQGVAAVLRLDPKKDGWRKMPRLMIAKCAEMNMLRKGWPEDLSRIYAEEETHRAHTLEGVDYEDVTPSGMAAAADAEKRQEALGGPSLFLVVDPQGSVERVLVGKFADRLLEVTEKMKPAEVADLVSRNREPLREFWSKNATDALALKKELEARSGSAGSPKAPADTTAPVVSNPPIVPDAAGAALSSKAELLASVEKIESKLGALQWAQNNKAAVNELTGKDRKEVMDAYYAKQQTAPA